MQTYSLTTLFKSVSTDIIPELPKSKAPSRFLSHKGKDFKSEIDTAGFCSLQVALAYLKWLELTDAQILTVLKNPAFDDVYGLYAILDALPLEELTSAFGTTDALELAKHLAPVNYMEVLEDLPLAAYVQTLPILPTTFQQANDSRRVLMLKHYAAPTWHRLNQTRLAEEAHLASIAKIEKEEAEYQAAIAAGEVQVTPYTANLSKKEVEAFEAAIDSLDGKVPAHLSQYNTAKVRTSIAQFEQAFRDNRAKAEAERIAKEKARLYAIDRDTFQATTPVLQAYGVKGVLLESLAMMSNKPAAIVGAYRKAAQRDFPHIIEVVDMLLEYFSGDVDAAIALLNTDNPLDFFYDCPETSTIRPIFNFEGAELLEGALAKYESDIIEYKHMLYDIPKPKGMGDVEAILQKYSNLHLFHETEGYTLSLKAADTTKAAYCTTISELHSQVEKWVKDFHSLLVPQMY